MALLTTDMQDKLIALLVDEGLVSAAAVQTVKDESVREKKPFFEQLADKHIIDDEMLTHAIAQISGVPYVNLTNSMISQEVLGLLNEDVAERFMAVPWLKFRTVWQSRWLMQAMSRLLIICRTSLISH